MKYCVTINDKRYAVEVDKGEAAIISTTEIALTTDEKHSYNNGKAASEVKSLEPEAIPEKAKSDSDNTYGEVVKAPMAGGITGVKVSVGSAVKAGDTLLLLEAMKMENEITAHKDGVVKEILVSNGSLVSAEDVLVVLG